jgi:D-3-phosphoglycerate dehydrogenase / 2-oxoglutarate reductase
LWEATLRRSLQPITQNLEIRRLDVGWPDEPLIFSDEIAEYVGDPADVARIAADADALVTHVGPVTRSILEQCPGLRIIGCCRGGAVNVNVPAASERGIPVVNSPGRNAQAVIEFTLGMILSERRGIARAHAALSQGVWEGYLYRYDRAGRELQGQTIGLVGFGAIAQGLTPYLKPFGVRILTFDPYVSDARLAELGVVRVDLPTLLRESDVVSIHARVTPETRKMIGAVQLAMMKPTATLINTARGPLVDYEALYDALVNDRIAGAALDCLESEPPSPDWPLLRLHNVTLSPHIGGASRSSAERGAEQVAEDIANFFAGRPLLRCVNLPGDKSN